MFNFDKIDTLEIANIFKLRFMHILRDDGKAWDFIRDKFIVFSLRDYKQLRF